MTSEEQIVTVAGFLISGGIPAALWYWLVRPRQLTVGQKLSHDVANACAAPSRQSAVVQADRAARKGVKGDGIGVEEIR